MTEKPPNSATRLLTGRFWAIFVLVVLPPAACGVAFDAHKVAWYTVFPYTYYIEIKADLTVDGAPVEVTGVAECTWVHRTKPIITPHLAGSSFDRRGGILAKRLPSGGAVIVLVDPPCRARGDPSGFGGARKGFWKTVRPLDAPVGYLPIQTLLLDDAGEPTRIERSFSKAYFADPRAHVGYLGGTWKPMKRGVRTDPREEVPWLRVESGSSKAWAGFFARVTSREVWSQSSSWANVLESLKQVTKLTGELRPPSNGFYLTDGIVRTLYLRDGYWDYRPDVPDPDGLVVLYERKDPVPPWLSVKGQPTGVTPPIDSWAIYEPESKTILLIRGDVVSVSAGEVRFDRGSNTLSGRLFKL